ncbi:hypothetical protein BDY17DRAFT_298714 [Neohortaea acidophila]|uniref:Uncharacterized protein n=1 Tax=Neohortaea acidophila TaxID=245834 RepID=A0A6A6PRY9_9PEZI|nr:uncharacterized protein BDY17DRAFT_298714 [Neohortaea acidophila]KAF2482546.1 hypothetical protein BDY17DRAFT_298714 [Neohortaea acidophila]
MPSAQDTINTDSGSPSVSLPKKSAREISEQYSHMRSTEERPEDNYMLGGDEEPMVYSTPRDYATSARRERDWLLSMGADPDSVILESELCNYMPPRRAGESAGEYSKQYVEILNGMIRNGTMILNDQTTADVVASGFGTRDGRRFDLGPGSGATKGDFRAFTQWFGEVYESGEAYEVPERWLRFEEPQQRVQD